jgi:hypothetical protein
MVVLAIDAHFADRLTIALLIATVFVSIATGADQGLARADNSFRTTRTLSSPPGQGPDPALRSQPRRRVGGRLDSGNGRRDTTRHGELAPRRRHWMKKTIAIAGLFALAAALTAGEGFGDPNFFYKPATFGMLLPEDTVVTEDEGTTFYVSEGASLGVIVSPAEKAIKSADILDEKKFAAALKELGAFDIKPWSSVPEGDLVYNSAKVKMKWDDGSVDEGYMVLLNSKAAKNKTFIIGIFLPKLPDDYENPAFVALETLTYGKAP